MIYNILFHIYYTNNIIFDENLKYYVLYYILEI
jgi:hypothetical protein